MVNTAFDNEAALGLYDTFGFNRRRRPLSILELRLDDPGMMVATRRTGRCRPPSDSPGRWRSRGVSRRRCPLAVAPIFAAPVTPTAQPSTPNHQAAEVGVQIELIDERYSFGPDASLHLVYRLTGDLASLELGVDHAGTTIPERSRATETIPVDHEPGRPRPPTPWHPNRRPLTPSADTTVPTPLTPLRSR